MALRIQTLQAGAEHSHGLARHIQRALMGRTINPQSQAAGDDKTALSQAAGKRLGSIQARSRGMSAAHHGQLWQLQDVRSAGDKQQRRGVIQFRQQRGVGRSIPHQQLLLGLLQPEQCRGRLFAHRTAAACLGATRRQTQRAPGRSRRTEGRRGTAKGVQQTAKTPRAQLRQAVQAQTGFQFGRGNSRRE